MLHLSSPPSQYISYAQHPTTYVPPIIQANPGPNKYLTKLSAPEASAKNATPAHPRTFNQQSLLPSGLSFIPQPSFKSKQYMALVRGENQSWHFEVDPREAAGPHSSASMDGLFRQFPLACISRHSGRASAPTIPQTVQTMRGRNARTSTASLQRSAGRTARWWHSSHVTASDRTPSSRMLPSVIGGPGWEGIGPHRRSPSRPGRWYIRSRQARGGAARAA